MFVLAAALLRTDKQTNSISRSFSHSANRHLMTEHYKNNKCNIVSLSPSSTSSIWRHNVSKVEAQVEVYLRPSLVLNIEQKISTMTVWALTICGCYVRTKKRNKDAKFWRLFSVWGLFERFHVRFVSRDDNNNECHVRVVIETTRSLHKCSSRSPFHIRSATEQLHSRSRPLWVPSQTGRLSLILNKHETLAGEREWPLRIE